MRKLKLHLLAATACLIVAGCAAEVNVRGNAPPDDKLSQVTPGMTREQVMELLGSPSSIATFTDQAWYYIGQRTEDYAFYKPKVIERQVVVVQFNDLGQVSEVKKLEKDDGKPVEMVERTTPTVSRDLSLMQQIFGNLGKSPALPGGGGGSSPGQSGPQVGP
jgi:outer membrane protein assembly factor BamE (lipoprotein component of BamABCDE complex)